MKHAVTRPWFVHLIVLFILFVFLFFIYINYLQPSNELVFLGQNNKKTQNS